MVLVKNIIDKFGCIKFLGDIESQLSDVSQLNESNTRSDVLFWCNNKNLYKLEKMTHGTFICSELALQKNCNKQCNFIIVDNPRLYIGKVIEAFFYNPPIRQGVSKSAFIHPTSKIGANCYIGQNVVIEENCIIGDNCSIDHNTTLHYGTIIKNNVKIGCNNAIGGFGFGYEKNESGQHIPIPHLGNVVIEDNVEICNNSCIDRAAMGSTIIGEGVKIDNLVHIAHGVQIGKNSLIIANAMIAGSTIIGENVWFAPSSSVINSAKIGNNSTIGLASVIIRDVADGVTVVGNPARELVKKQPA